MHSLINNVVACVAKRNEKKKSGGKITGECEISGSKKLQEGEYSTRRVLALEIKK
jgi:hypothetical protein